MAGIAELGHNPDVWVVPEFKVVYVATAKNACTTLKWVMADIGREDTSTFTSGLKPYIDDGQVVHHRDLFRNVQYPSDLDPALAADVHPDNGWFVFGVARDPRPRLFSAWEDKLLLHEPGFRALRVQPWFPGYPQDADTIRAEFRRFVSVVAAEPDLELMRDDHFRSQVSSLQPDRIPYSRIYPIEQMTELHADLTTHLAGLGWHEPVHFRRSNDSPLKATAAVLADGVGEQIERIYAEDFAAFGSMWDPARIDAVPDWTAAQIHDAQVRAMMGRRLGDVRQSALHFRRKANDAHEKLATLRQERVTLERRLDAAEAKTAKLEKRVGALDRGIGGVRRDVVATRRKAEAAGRKAEAADRKAEGVARAQRSAAAGRPSARARRLAGRIVRRLRG